MLTLCVFHCDLFCFSLTQHIEFYFSDPHRTNVFNPVSVRFLGAPNFSNNTSEPALVRPPELGNIDVTRDVTWTFSSAMLTDEQHIVTVCKGHIDHSPQHTLLAAKSHSPAINQNTSIFQVPQLDQLVHLGSNVSRPLANDAPHLATAEHLQVRQISHTQIVPARAQTLI